jgi:hypothetical protein
MSIYNNFGMEPTRLGRGQPVRIGDVERDGAIAALSEHFAAGRLSRDELDERVEQAMSAKFDADLVPLLADLPSSSPPPPRRSASAPQAVQLLWGLLPVLLVALVVTALVTGVPWLLWSVFWVFMMSGYGGRRAHAAYQRQQHHQPR